MGVVALLDGIGQIDTGGACDGRGFWSNVAARDLTTLRDGARTMPAMDPVAERQFSLALNDPVVPSASDGVQPDETTARRIADGVTEFLAEALSGARRPRSPEFLRNAFLQDAARIAAEQEIELSEEDWMQLLNEAIALEATLRTSEQVRVSFEDLLGRIFVGWAGGYGWANRRRS